MNPTPTLDVALKIKSWYDSEGLMLTAILGGLILGQIFERAAIQRRAMPNAIFDTGVGEHGIATKYALYRNFFFYTVKVCLRCCAALILIGDIPPAWRIFSDRDNVGIILSACYVVATYTGHFIIDFLFWFYIARCLALRSSWRKVEQLGKKYNTDVEYRLNFLGHNGEPAYDATTREARTQKAREWLAWRQKGIWLRRLQVWGAVFAVITVYYFLDKFKIGVVNGFDLGDIATALIILWMMNPLATMWTLRVDDMAFESNAQYTPFSRVIDPPRPLPNKKKALSDITTANVIVFRKKR